jgi:gamma-glutamylcyclotransferase (GGCT)/AIG2-like uncharacterized protein YtfP
LIPSDEPVRPLFAYGTLRDPDYQRELFGRTYQMHRAWVAGYIARVSRSGYLAAAPRLGALIDGAIVEIDAAGLAVADAWEDLDVYDRIEIDAQRADGRIVRCWIYVIADVDGPPVVDARLADRTRAEIIADIRRFRAGLDATSRE